MPCGSYWAVCQTHPQAERWAQQNLQRQGFQTFLPLMRVRVRDRATPSIVHTVQRPLFTSYLFVTVDAHWAPIANSRGVRRLLMTDGKPGIVARAAIEALRAAEALAATQPPDRTSWAPGMPCSLAAGPFEGHPAVVLKAEKEMALVSVMMFGQLREVAVQLDCLAARD